MLSETGATGLIQNRHRARMLRPVKPVCHKNHDGPVVAVGRTENLILLKVCYSKVYSQRTGDMTAWPPWPGKWRRPWPVGVAMAGVGPCCGKSALKTEARRKGHALCGRSRMGTRIDGHGAYPAGRHRAVALGRDPPRLDGWHALSLKGGFLPAWLDGELSCFGAKSSKQHRRFPDDGDVLEGHAL